MGGSSSSESKGSDSSPASTDKVEYAKTPEELAQGKPRCKSCCACPETRQLRDDCVAEKGIENCQPLIDAHNECMRLMGFNMGPASKPQTAK